MTYRSKPLVAGTSKSVSSQQHASAIRAVRKLLFSGLFETACSSGLPSDGGWLDGTMLSPRLLPTRWLAESPLLVSAECLSYARLHAPEKDSQ